MNGQSNSALNWKKWLKILLYTPNWKYPRVGLVFVFSHSLKIRENIQTRTYQDLPGLTRTYQDFHRKMQQYLEIKILSIIIIPLMFIIDKNQPYWSKYIQFQTNFNKSKSNKNNNNIGEHSYMTSDVFRAFLTYLPTLIRYFTT